MFNLRRDGGRRVSHLLLTSESAKMHGVVVWRNGNVQRLIEGVRQAVRPWWEGQMERSRAKGSDLCDIPPLRQGQEAVPD